MMYMYMYMYIMYRYTSIVISSAVCQMS